MRDHLGNPFFSGRPEFARGVLLLDDFEGTFNWEIAGTGGDDIHERLAAAALQGTYGMHLKTRTTGAAANDYVAASRSVNFPEAGLLCARVRVTSPDFAAVLSVSLDIYARNTSRVYRAAALWAPQTPSLSYLNSAGTPTAIAALAVPGYNFAWENLELVLDLRTFTYRNIRFAGLVADLTNVSFQNVGANTQRNIDIVLTVMADGAAPATLYADLVYLGEYEDI